MIHVVGLLASIAFVPLDDRPVTLQLPVMLGRIAGVRIETPPRRLLGRYLKPGDSDRIAFWLQAESRDRKVDAFVASSDMLAYGGLVASRVPGVDYAGAYDRLASLQIVRRNRPDAWTGVFGTVMRLAPTGIPAGTPFFAAYPQWKYLQEYANLKQPSGPLDPQVLEQYLATRERNFAVDRSLMQMTAAGTIDRLALGQDDAGPVGLHVREVAALKALLEASSAKERISIEPGADELGMAMTAHALAREASWKPTIAVRYSRPGGAAFQDPLEFAPIGTTIGQIASIAGAAEAPAGAKPDIALYVRVPGTTAAQSVACLQAMAADRATGISVALADLSFLKSYAAQGEFARALLSGGMASQLDAYSSWNTDANTVGTAIAEAIAAGAGRRLGTYDGLAHRTFTFVRFVDDYAFHDLVRPGLNAGLDARGIPDHTLLAPDVASSVALDNRALLWHQAEALLAQLYPGYHIAAMTVELPWDRTFETAIDVGIAPNLPAR